MKSHEELAELVAELLERFGVINLEPIDPDDLTEDDLSDRMGGCEGFSLDFNKTTYIMFPSDVQDQLLSLASAIYSDDYSDEEE